ncbi:MAG: LppX_LprAFG lipoprotein [Chloroflexi bacterium]|nr:LppX_LprAFG lipoprotein [Chloroflexota bacterium]MCC6896538.1 LppX_LprAFG lipoprotein [Anaerolineae bacterium]
MRRLGLIVVIVVIVILGISGCTGTPATTEPPPDAAALLIQATDNILAVNALKIIVDRTGADYILATDIGSAIFNRMEAQYVSPNLMQAKAKVTLSMLPVEIEIFARDDDQWWRLVGTKWAKQTFLPGFNPRALLTQEDRGLRAAFASLENVVLVEDTTLDDGTPVYHLTATADGDKISWMMLYLVQISGSTNIDVYIDKEKKLPQKLVVVQPETGTETVKPTTWDMEFYDFDVEANLQEPADSEVESTPEATADVTAEAAVETTTEPATEATTEATAEATVPS